MVSFQSVKACATLATTYVSTTCKTVCNSVYGKTPVSKKNGRFSYYTKATAKAVARLATVTGLGYGVTVCVNKLAPTKLGSKLKLTALTQKASQYAPKKLALAAGLVAVATAALWTYSAEKNTIKK